MNQISNISSDWFQLNYWSWTVTLLFGSRFRLPGARVKIFINKSCFRAQAEQTDQFIPIHSWSFGSWYKNIRSEWTPCRPCHWNVKSIKFVFNWNLFFRMEVINNVNILLMTFTQDEQMAWEAFFSSNIPIKLRDIECLHWYAMSNYIVFVFIVNFRLIHTGQ